MITVVAAGRRNPEQRVCERLAVSEHSKIPTFQEKLEVSHSGICSQEFTVKGKEQDSAEDSFLEKKSSGAQDP